MRFERLSFRSGPYRWKVTFTLKLEFVSNVMATSGDLAIENVLTSGRRPHCCTVRLVGIPSEGLALIV